MRNWVNEKSTVVFFVTLFIYILIWATVSYIGVYVTYVAGPVLVISGILAWFTAPKKLVKLQFIANKALKPAALTHSRLA